MPDANEQFIEKLETFAEYGHINMDLLITLAKTDKIKAIKILRVCSELGLKDAKDVIEVLLHTHVSISQERLNTLERIQALSHNNIQTPTYSELDKANALLAARISEANKVITNLDKQLSDARADVARLKRKINRILDMTGSLYEDEPFDYQDNDN